MDHKHQQKEEKDLQPDELTNAAQPTDNHSADDGHNHEGKEKAGHWGSLWVGHLQHSGH